MKELIASATVILENAINIALQPSLSKPCSDLHRVRRQGQDLVMISQTIEEEIKKTAFLKLELQALMSQAQDSASFSKNYEILFNKFLKSQSVLSIIAVCCMLKSLQLNEESIHDWIDIEIKTLLDFLNDKELSNQNKNYLFAIQRLIEVDIAENFIEKILFFFMLRRAFSKCRETVSSEDFDEEFNAIIEEFSLMLAEKYFDKIKEYLEVEGVPFKEDNTAGHFESRVIIGYPNRKCLPDNDELLNIKITLSEVITENPMSELSLNAKPNPRMAWLQKAIEENNARIEKIEIAKNEAMCEAYVSGALCNLM